MREDNDKLNEVKEIEMIKDNNTERKNEPEKINITYNLYTNISTKFQTYMPDLLEQHNNGINIKDLKVMNTNNSNKISGTIINNIIGKNHNPEEIENNESSEDIESESIIQRREKEINNLTKTFDILEDIKYFNILDNSKLNLDNESIKVKKIFVKKLRIRRKANNSIKKKKKQKKNVCDDIMIFINLTVEMKLCF